MRGTSYTDLERLARQVIHERVAHTRPKHPTSDRPMARRSRVRAGTAATLRRVAEALDTTN